MKKIIFLLILSPAAFGQKNYKSNIEKYLSAEVSINNFSGTVLVMKDNKAVVENAYGLANREWNIANTIDTKYRIGSITKQFTATCILQLQERHKLSVHDKLSKYIPDYPKGDSITIQMLLTHTSGIKNYTDLPGSEFWRGISRLPATEDSMISIFKNKPLDFSPGTNWEYSNSGYFLLGYIIEKVSGEKYGDYVDSHIFKIAGMHNSGVDRIDSVLYHRAGGYSKGNFTYVNTPFISMKSLFSAGAMYSTVQDLYKWDRVLYTNDIISDSSKKQMFTPYKNNYGYGVSIDTFLGHYRISHKGLVNGFDSYISRFTIDDICVVVLSNNVSNSQEISEGISAILFDVPVEAPYVHNEIHVDTLIFNKYMGEYKEDLKKIDIQIFKKNGKLYRGAKGTTEVELKPESETKFFYADGSDRQLEFETDSKGNVSKTWFVIGGLKTEIYKK
jgi:CubicO group peptidase (beta-lactamase class C family)